MRAYIQKIDITSNGKVIVSGLLSRTNLDVKLNEHIYIEEPEDGIWGYTLEVVPTSVYGADMMVPFSVEAPWTGNQDANGVRVIQPTLEPSSDDYETIQLKAKKVPSFTSEQSNLLILNGASYDKTSQQLIVDVNYGGGCFPHSFALEWDGQTLESAPPQYNFTIVDLSEYDPCDALLPAQLRFDINTPEINLQRPSTINLGTIQNKRQLKIQLD